MNAKKVLDSWKQITIIKSMTTTSKNLETIKAAVLKVINAKPATVEVVCFRLGLVVNRDNMRAIRAALLSLRADKAVKSHVIGGSQDVAYHV